jgi:LysR family glycine cleavage system transcriptional activator
MIRRRLPPLKAMLAFEAVARIGSVSAAADELGVTHSAVSKQLSTLEAWFGTELFADNRRRMVPTPAAARLALATGSALDLMSSAVDAVIPQATTAVLRVMAPATFAMRWLIPRLPLFQNRVGDVDVRVRPTHTTEAWNDIPHDVVIRRGGSLPSDLRVITLMREEITLVARPGVLSARAAEGPQCVAESRLLEAVTRPGELSTWLLGAGLAPDLAAGATRFGHFYIALEAALAGQGLLTAPTLVIADLLTRGELVEPFPGLRISGPDYRLGYDPGLAQTPLAAAFADWVVSEARTG